MKLPSPRKKPSFAFSLIELLVVMVIIGILAATLIPVLSKAKSVSKQSACLSNMRQLAIAFHLYTGDHDYDLPGRVNVPGQDKWPKLLYEYTKTTKVFSAPGIEDSTGESLDLLSNATDNTSFIMNGYNDLGAYGNPDFHIKIISIPSPAQTILLGMPKAHDTNFYMDYNENNHTTILNLEAYGLGSNYVFADGSARFIKEADYQPIMWAVDKNYTVPGQ
ncbi:MAG: type II secretion system protein [Chthoniobacterales bacterium]